MDFTLATAGGFYVPNWHHEYLALELDRFLREVEEERSPRLIVTMPPRHGKSQLCSCLLPALAFGKHPDWFIIHASFTARLSNYWSRQTRDLLYQPEYQELFPGIYPDPASRSAAEWSIYRHRGFFLSGGVGGSQTGRGAHILIIDDPIKNAQAADSPTIRKSQRDWYDTTADTRLEKGGGVLMILTRWHTADLAGYVLHGEEGERAGEDDLHFALGEDDSDLLDEVEDRWRVVNLPAIAERDEHFEIAGRTFGRKEGEALWEDRQPLRRHLQRKRRYPPRWWRALFQQDPVQEGGNLLHPASIIHQELEAGLRARIDIYQAWDLAISEKEGADYTVCVTIGVDEWNNIYILDVFRRRLSFHQQMDAIGTLARVWNPCRIGIETVQYQTAAFQEASRRYLLPFVELKPGGRDKVSRAQLIADRIDLNTVYADKRKAWWKTLEDEAISFPNGAFKDQVDALAYTAHLANGNFFAAGAEPVETEVLEEFVDRDVSPFEDTGSAGFGWGGW